jgi:serine/threonine-protein phosphatase 4 regulatory subunit 2
MDLFPPLTEAEVLSSAGRSAITLGSTLQSAPGTPLFSPIPFLHDDARRSKSRSPPPLPPSASVNANATTTVANAGEEPVELRALGLVDELDDPRPGHLSDHPVALSSVTTLPADSSKLFSLVGSSSSLEQRFVKAGELDSSFPAGDVPMELDEDKENTKT